MHASLRLLCQCLSRRRPVDARIPCCFSVNLCHRFKLLPLSVQPTRGDHKGQKRKNEFGHIKHATEPWSIIVLLPHCATATFSVCVSENQEAKETTCFHRLLLFVFSKAQYLARSSPSCVRERLLHAVMKEASFYPGVGQHAAADRQGTSSRRFRSRRDATG